MTTYSALIIDDSKIQRRMMSEMLGELGFSSVQEAVDGEDGLARLSASVPPSVVLVDWNMPKLSGVDFIRKIRADRRFDDMRVVMVSTRSEVVDVAEGLQAGADEFVMKPFTPEIIADKLRLVGLQLPESDA